MLMMIVNVGDRNAATAIDAAVVVFVGGGAGVASM